MTAGENQRERDWVYEELWMITEENASRVAPGITHNVHKMKASMGALSSVDINPKG